jgi:hypothetical protein
MLIPFENMPKTSRIWIYQANRNFSETEIQKISSVLLIKMEAWAAHGASLLSAFNIFHNRFVVVALDENQNAASGCSIDASTHWFKELGADLNINFFDRSIAYMFDNEIHTVDLLGVKKAVSDEMISAETITFNNLINTLGDFEQNWKVPASKSWLKKYFVPVSV